VFVDAIRALLPRSVFYASCVGMLVTLFLPSLTLTIFLPKLHPCINHLQGVLVYEMVYGWPPFYHDDPMKVLVVDFSFVSVSVSVSWPFDLALPASLVAATYFFARCWHRVLVFFIFSFTQISLSLLSVVLFFFFYFFFFFPPPAHTQVRENHLRKDQLPGQLLAHAGGRHRQAVHQEPVEAPGQHEGRHRGPHQAQVVRRL
jgi:hypothetical protein